MARCPTRCNDELWPGPVERCYGRGPIEIYRRSLAVNRSAVLPLCSVLLCWMLASLDGPRAPQPFLGSIHPAGVPVVTAASGRRPAGRIEGRITVKEKPARRVPSRYPGGSAGNARPVERIPAVVYLEGRFEAARAGGPFEMAQEDTAFAPAVVVVPVHADVRFPNHDPFFHNVFSYSTAQRFDLGRYPRGESKTVRFDEPGVVKVYCEVHQSMRGAIVVTENPFHAILGPDGTFALDGVPPGAHKLVVWHVDLGSTTREIRVTDGGTARVDLTIG